MARLRKIIRQDEMEESGGNEECTDLLEAARKRRLRLTRLLLDGGSSVNITDEEGRSVLTTAILSTYEDSQSTKKETYVRFLLERGVDLNYRDRLGKTALIHVCQKQLGICLVRLLLEFKADATIVDKYGMSPLLYAADCTDDAILGLLAEACKAKGKDVIIVRPKVQPQLSEVCTSTDNFSSSLGADSDMFQGDILQNAKSSEAARGFLSVPSSGDDAPDNMDRHHDGKPKVIGSPKPKPKLHSLQHCEGNVSIEVPSPTDIRSSSIAMMRADSLSDDNLNIIHSPDAETTSKQGGRVRVLRRRNTADLFPASACNSFTPPASRKGAQGSRKQLLNPLKECSLDEVKVSLLEWEKELTKTVDSRVSRQQNTDPYRKVAPLSLMTFRHPELEIDFPTQGHPFNSEPVRKTSSLKGLEKSPKDYLPVGYATPQGRRRIIGPGGRILERQGSGAKLFDVISFTRPGTLPPLNINVNPPIPGIGNRIASADDIRGRLGNAGRTPNNSISSTPDSDSAPSPTVFKSDDPEAQKIKEAYFKRYISEEKRVISHPSRKFFTKKSATLEMGEIFKLLSTNDQRKCLPHIGEYGYGS